jgi:hypothetical protein
MGLFVKKARSYVSRTRFICFFSFEKKDALLEENGNDSEALGWHLLPVARLDGIFNVVERKHSLYKLQERV